MSFIPARKSYHWDLGCDNIFCFNRTLKLSRKILYRTFARQMPGFLAVKTFLFNRILATSDRPLAPGRDMTWPYWGFRR
jgi:hypothetical protein